MLDIALLIGAVLVVFFIMKLFQWTDEIITAASQGIVTVLRDASNRQHEKKPTRRIVPDRTLRLRRATGRQRGIR